MRMRLNGVHRKSLGFTLIEVLVVMVILTVLFGLVLAATRRFHTRSLLTTEARHLVADLRRAQALAQAGENNTAWGVRFETTPTNRWVVFRGATYSSADPANEYNPIEGGVDIVSLVLTGGGQDVVFLPRRGITGQWGDITLRSADAETLVVSVNAEGTVDIAGP